jgi:uncharacterized membrane protein
MVSLEIILSWVLRSGVLSAAVLMILGFLTAPAILWAGIVVLALTPLLRVVISGLVFLNRGDRFFFLIALYVIIVLVISIFIWSI